MTGTERDKAEHEAAVARLGGMPEGKAWRKPAPKRPAKVVRCALVSAEQGRGKRMEYYQCR